MNEQARFSAFDHLERIEAWVYDALYLKARPPQSTAMSPGAVVGAHTTATATNNHAGQNTISSSAPKEQAKL